LEAGTKNGRVGTVEEQTSAGKKGKKWGGNETSIKGGHGYRRI